MTDRNVNVRLSAQVGQFVAAMQAAAASTKNVTQSGVDLAKLGGQVQNFGRAATLGLTAPMTAAGVAAVGMSNKFNTSFTRMSTLAGVATSELGGMRSAVLELSKQTGRGPQELADALYAASSSGLDARQSLEAVTIAAKGAAAGLGSTEDIISLVASATASYGAANMDAATATDILVGTIREGRADPDELAGSLGRILPVAASLGVSFEEVGGSVAFLSNVFGDTNRTVTAMSGVFNKLQSPTDAAREALNQYGTSMEELHRIIDEDGLLGAMRHLQEIGLSDDPLAFRAVFDDVEARQGAQAMVDNLDALEEAIGGVRDSAGALDEAFAAAQGEDGFKMAQAWAEIQVALVEFGDAIGPIAADVASAVADIASAFASLPEGVQIAIAAAVIALGPMAYIAGTFMKHAQTIAAARALMTGASAAGGASGFIGPVGPLGQGASVGALPTAAIIASAIANAQPKTGFMRQRNPQTGEWEFVDPSLNNEWTRSSNLSLWSQFGQGAATGGFVGRPAWSMASAGSPFTSSGPIMQPVSGQDAYNMLGNVFQAGGGLAGPSGTAVENVAAMRAEVEQLERAMEGYADVARSTDWGAASLAGAATAMSKFTADQFGLVNIAMAAEEAYARLNASVEEHGFTLDVATEAGRANMQALQGVASTLDTSFASAYAGANGNLGKFKAAATEIGSQTLTRLQTELGLTDEQTASLAETLGLTATDYEARFNLAGDEEAKIRLGLLSGVIGLLQEDVQREVAMRIATGDFQGALDLVQANIAETPDSHTTAMRINDQATDRVYSIQRAINSVTGKTVTITVRQQGGVRSYDYGGGQVALSRGGVFDRATDALIGEDGLEVALPLTKPNRLRELLSDPRVMVPVAAAMAGVAGGRSSGSSSAPLSSGGSDRPIVAHVHNNRRDLTTSELSDALRLAGVR